MYGLIILFVGVTLHKMRALGHDIEPRCSKYDFEEKVLEKMVRLEHSTNLIMDEFRAIKTQVSSNLDTMRKETDAMKTVLDEERKRITDTMTAEIANNREVLEEIEGKTSKSFYAFAAYWLTNDFATLNAVLIFSRTLFDEDESYNNKTGKYTVPVSGTYLLTSILCVGQRDYASVDIVADGATIGVLILADIDYNTCSSGTAVAQLQRNVQVWLKVTSTSNKCRNNESSDGFNYFAGHLISESH